MERFAVDYDFDWYVVEHEYCENKKDNPGAEPNENDFKFLEYSELLMQAKEAGLGYRVEWEDVLYLVPTPLVKIDERNRFHSLKEPAIRWKGGKEFYYINGVNFDEKLWKKISGNKLSAKEVFSIKNAEQRRIAYQYMDKLKMKKLKDYKVLDEVKDDGQGYPMKLISFSTKQFDTPFVYLNCFCPSTGREYFIETESKTCSEAKNKSFGLDNVNFLNEY